LCNNLDCLSLVSLSSLFYCLWVSLGAYPRVEHLSHTYTYTYIHIHICVYVCVCMCMCVCKYSHYKNTLKVKFELFCHQNTKSNHCALAEVRVNCADAKNIKNARKKTFPWWPDWDQCYKTFLFMSFQNKLECFYLASFSSLF
jgi:hypothetical protein